VPVEVASRWIETMERSARLRRLAEDDPHCELHHLSDLIEP
jgi:hypothetical protein